MHDIFGRIVAILLCSYLMFIYPLNSVKEENKQLERMYLYNETVWFVDSVRNIGKMESSDVQVYKDKISSLTGNYRLELEHKKYSDENGPEEILYELQIYRMLDTEQVYYFNCNDLFNIRIYNEKGNLVVCYGGGIKAIQEEQENAEEI